MLISTLKAKVKYFMCFGLEVISGVLLPTTLKRDAAQIIKELKTLEKIVKSTNEFLAMNLSSAKHTHTHTHVYIQQQELHTEKTNLPKDTIFIFFSSLFGYSEKMTSLIGRLLKLNHTDIARITNFFYKINEMIKEEILQIFAVSVCLPLPLPLFLSLSIYIYI